KCNVCTPDVHLVETYVAKKRTEQEESNSRKRPGEDDGGHVLKVSREDSATVDDIKELNNRNRTVALSDSTMNGDLSSTEIADTMICGRCRFVTADYEAFKDHRIAGCRDKGRDEPKYLRCASCDNRFKSAWGLLCHLTEFHRMMLYKVDDEPVSWASKESGSKQDSGTSSAPRGTPSRETPEKSRQAALEPTLQQPRTPQQQDHTQSTSYGTVFPNPYAKTRLRID
ncbi:hypothetical protein COOONC_02937, partial [Cooperia oncophora]